MNPLTPQSIHPAYGDIICLDLDGTLVDTLPDIAAALNQMLSDLGCGHVALDQVRNWIGNGSRRTVLEALRAQTDCDPEAELVSDAMARYIRHYRVCCTEYSTLYPGVEEAIAYWRYQGQILACVTNKASQFTRRLLHHFGIEQYFAQVVCGDTLLVQKPDPLPLLYACRQLGAVPSNALMIGDSRNDVLAARAAGMAVVCVSYGYNEGREIVDEQPDAIIERLDLFARAGALMPA